MISQIRIEHVNLTVSDIERSAALFEKLLGWRERWRGPALGGGESIHVGDDQVYLALYTDRLRHERFPKGAPLNHVGLQVDDLDAAERVGLGRDRVRACQLRVSQADRLKAPR